MDASEIWRQVMEITPAPRTYEGTYVLLLGWAVDYDDTGTAQEFMALREVLEKSYGCVVRLEHLHTKDHPQILATQHVANFVRECDQVNRLLVVCYGGHGAVGTNDSLMLSGIATAGHDVQRERDINWVQVESSLNCARADVLVVLDCCQAGVLRGPVYFDDDERRKFQYIAACSATGSTPCAGDSSFTSAMIWALGTLSREPGFTTSQLADTLRAHRHFPRCQEPLVFSRKYGPWLEDIWIASKTPEERPGMIPQQIHGRREIEISTAAVLDLRFHFAEPATSRDIESMAMTFRASLKHETFDFLFQEVSFRTYRLNVAGEGIAEELQPGDPVIDNGLLVERGMPGDAVEDQNNGLLHRISRTLGLVFQGRGPVPAWHGTAFV